MYEHVNYHSVPQIRPPFCNLSFSTKRREGLYARCNDFSCDYALPSGTGKVRPHCRWGVGADAPGATGRVTSFIVRGEEAERFREVAGVSIIDAGSSRSQ